MEKRKKTLLILGLCIFTLTLIGLSYAFWQITLQQDDENEIATACLDIEKLDEGTGITLNPGYPILDSDGEALDPYTFKIHNKCQDNLQYQVNLEIINTSTLDKKYIKVKLNEVDAQGTIQYLTNAVNPTLTTGSSIAKEAYKIETGYLTKDETKSFEFRQWMDGSIEGTETESMNKEFHSKITITATYVGEKIAKPEVDLELAVCEKAITAKGIGTPSDGREIRKYEFKIDQENTWSSNENVDTKEFTGLENGNHTVSVKVTDDKGVTNETSKTIEIKDPDMITISGKQIPIATCKNGLYALNHKDANVTEGWNETEYRYAGVNYDADNNPTNYVHNYVTFNEEKWRIIGLVNVTTPTGIEQRVKIIKNEQLDKTMQWNSVEEEYWQNDWTESSLMTELNGNYYQNSLNDTAKNLIDENIIWNIGGVMGDDRYLFVNNFYKYERGTSPAAGGTQWKWDSTNTYHPATFHSIGLMYPSDYGYAVGGTVRDTCFTSTKLEDYEEDCANNDWLYLGSDEWLITADMTYSHLVYYIMGGYHGPVTSDDAGLSNAVRPTIYLKENVHIKDDGNDGSYENPFNLELMA